MINSNAALAQLVQVLQSIPDLVSAMAGDATNIQAYYDIYPGRSAIQVAIKQLPTPGMLVVYQGYGKSSMAMATVDHKFLIYVRAQIENTNDQMAAGYSTVLQMVTDGVPTLNNPAGQSLRYLDPIDGCWGMVEAPVTNRRTDREGLDYFEISIVFPQWGDLLGTQSAPI
jgi:hypothetical protein